MMIEIVELTISCMSGQGTYTRFKAKYSKKETLHAVQLSRERKLQSSRWIQRMRTRRRYGLRMKDK
jgi:hypothetical protein